LDRFFFFLPAQPAVEESQPDLARSQSQLNTTRSDRLPYSLLPLCL